MIPRQTIGGGAAGDAGTYDDDVEVTIVNSHVLKRDQARRLTLAAVLPGGYGTGHTAPAVVSCTGMQAQPAAIPIEPRQRIEGSLRVPGSKSITNRALVVAALASGTSRLEGALIAEDTSVMIGALTRLGFDVTVDGTTFSVTGHGGAIPAERAELDLVLSGTSLRFLTAVVALGRGRYRLTGNERMQQRPIADLLTALRALGVAAESELKTGCPPVIVEANGVRGGSTRISGENSSQYLSALLMMSPYAREPVVIEVAGELQSKPFVDLTLAVMAAFGVQVQRDGYRLFRIEPAQYRPRDYSIEGDAMAAGYLWAAAAVTGGRVTVENVGRDSLQGDKRLADVLSEMGCQVRWDAASCTVTGPPGGRLQGGRFDLNDMPDQAQTLAVCALFADRPVRIDNVSNLRIKETDRLRALAVELERFGARVEEGRDYLVVHPPEHFSENGATVETYKDHRMAMAFAVAGLRLPGVVIKDPGCVAKTFPAYFNVLATL